MPPSAVCLPGEAPTPHLLLQLCSLWSQTTGAPALEEVQGEAVEEESERRQQNKWRKKSEDRINGIWVLAFLVIDLS